MKNKVCAGIILYYPDTQRLSENIAAVLPQVEKIILIDNGTNDDCCLENIYNDPQIYIWIKNNQNLGVAKALNQIVECADDLGYDWVLTLDQDSVCCPNLVDVLIKFAAENPKAGIVAPYVIDINVTTKEEYQQLELEEYEKIKMCVSSGSLTNVKIAKSIDGFDEKLFIDHVDHDFCLRLYRAGFYVIRANKVWIFHEIGKIKKIYILHGIGKITGIKWLLKPYHILNHPPIRIYYQTRNLLYMLRKYKKEFTDHPLRYWTKFFFGMFLRILSEDRKILKTVAFIKGLFFI